MLFVKFTTDPFLSNLLHRLSHARSRKPRAHENRILPTLLIALLISLIATAEHPPCCGPICPPGQRLASFLDKMDVESLWLTNEHVNWETGKPGRGAGYEGPGNHTHCSAFAAAAAMRLRSLPAPSSPARPGAALQRPGRVERLPEGQKAGWRPVSDIHQAQHLANHGQLVLFPNPNPPARGHVAILRPSEKSTHALESDGPVVI
jgi:hypothetical protein